VESGRELEFSDCRRRPKIRSASTLGQLFPIAATDSLRRVSPRTPDTCRHYQIIEHPAVPSCSLLRSLLNTDGKVSHEICQACCRGFEPSERDLNPVIASLVWSQAQEQLSNPDCPDRARWQELEQRAEANLPVVLPDEDDLPVVQAMNVSQQRPVVSILEVLPLPAQRVGRVTQWAVGVTTAPRRSPTLATCLRSLAAVGWDRPHLFIDGDLEIPAEFGTLPRTVHLPSLGARQSYYLALQELLALHPGADALMLVQDDALWPAHLPVREYLEWALWPDLQRGLVSCWCCSDDTASEAGWHTIARPWKFGAVAFIFPRECAERFVRDPEIQHQCRSGGNAATAGISMLIGNWAWQAGIPISFTTPSLVQHIGEVSAIYETSRAVGIRRASRYLGDEVRA